MSYTLHLISVGLESSERPTGVVGESEMSQGRPLRFPNATNAESVPSDRSGKASTTVNGATMCRR